MLAFKINAKSSTTRLAERNSMISPTQMVVGKDKSNPLITEDLLKTLRDLIPPITIQRLRWLRIEEYIGF